MDKILKVDFWKKLKFATKTDGISFMNTQPELLNLYQDLDLKLENCHDTFRLEFFNSFNLPHIFCAKKQFILDSKNTRKTDKIKKDKESAKIEAKVEIVLEEFIEKGLLPSGWENDPSVFSIYTNLVLTKNIFKIKTTTLELLKITIENKWKAEHDLNLLVSKLDNF
jgi:hypothetical protein